MWRNWWFIKIRGAFSHIDQIPAKEEGCIPKFTPEFLGEFKHVLLWDLPPIPVPSATQPIG